MTNTRQADAELLEEIRIFQKEFMQNHRDCTDGIDFPDGSHTCRDIEQAIIRRFKKAYQQNMTQKLDILHEL